MATPNSTTQLRCCTKCKRELPATTEYFQCSARNKCGLTPRCKQCINVAKREYAKKNPQKLREWGQRTYQKHIEKNKASRKAYYEANKKRLAEAAKQWAKENSDKIRETKRRWKKNNPDKVRADVRAQYWRNPEKKRERSRRQYAENPEKHRQYRRAYYAKNAERLRAEMKVRRLSDIEAERERRRRRRTLKKKLPFNFGVNDERRALEYFNGTCAVCGRPLRDLFGTHHAAMDHWVPLSKGGATVPTNIVPLCAGRDGCNNRKKDRDAHEWLIEAFGARRAVQIEKRIEQYFADIGHE